MNPSLATSAPWLRRTHATPLLMGHRGAPTECPENTLASFAAALEAGADVIEMDVRTTADGELVVIHDATVDRVSHGTGAVQDFSLRALQALELRGTPPADKGAACRIPRLKDVFAAFPQAAMNVDLSAVGSKDVASVFAWIRSVQAQPQARLRVLLTSSSTAVQAAIAANNAGGEVSLGMGRADVMEVLKAAWLRRAPIERLRGRACQMPAYLEVLGINVPLLVGPLPAYLRKMDCPLHVWWDTHGMVDDAYRLEKCKRWGVDGVFTNEVRALIQLRDQGCGDIEPEAQ